MSLIVQDWTSYTDDESKKLSIFSGIPLNDDGVVVVLKTVFRVTMIIVSKLLLITVSGPFSWHLMWLPEGLKHFEARFAFFDEIASKKF